ncbi:MAG: hypothetical protein VB049_05975 [Candidatus Pelethousia sp.]|nr:hypothetical protein [Candidatus Pelethousia sp.]
MDGNWGSIIAAIAALSGILVGWVGRAREFNKSNREEAAASAALRADMDYIKSGVDEIKTDLRAQDKDIDQLRERVTKVEENAKSTQHRLDRIEKDITKY